MNTRNEGLTLSRNPGIAVMALVIWGSGCTVDFGIGTGSGDAGPPDANVEDAGSLDGALSDAALPDGGSVDAASPDAGPPDAGQQDAAVTCGDGVLDVDEECDDGINNSDTAPNACRNNCHLPGCGDGVTDTGEQCDDGANNSNIVPNACRLSCRDASCGDAVTDTGEQCDDGNSVNTDACRSTCVSASCGDGVVWIGHEQCDDGNTIAGDGCSGTCSEENLPQLSWLSTTSGGWSTPWAVTYAGEIHAPTTPIRAAAGVENAGRVILFTQTTYHVLRIPQLTWYDSGTLGADFDFMPSAGPQAGYGLAGATTSGVTLISGHWAYIYDYTHVSGNVSFVTSSDLNTNSGWLTAEAPDPSQMVSMYLDLSNDHGWVNDTLFAACGSGSGDVVGHSISITGTLLHLQEIGNCFEFFDQMSFTAFAPFANSVSGRPAQSEIRGTFYFDTTNTLYVVTQQ